MGPRRATVNGRQVAKVERMAVLDNYRRQGIGEALLRTMIEAIKKEQGIEAIVLGAQDYAIPFYARFGFEIDGEGYMDGGTIPHHDMRLSLAP
jgi:predicted GNAT family N-acyltransferase